MTEYMFLEEGEGLFTEREIDLQYGQNFNLPNDEGSTYRHLTNWHLSLPQSKINRHVELPAEPQDLGEKQYVLYGLLVALESSGTDVDVRLDDLICWSIDRDSTLRGIWVQTTSGTWYMLKEPCQHQPHVDLNITVAGQKVQNKVVTGTLPAQVECHIEDRAKLGLISNLTDVLWFLGDDKYLARHSKKPPQDLYEELLPTEQMLAKYSERASEPFDLRLLKRYPRYVYTHIQDLLPPGCKFLASLKNATRDHWSAQDFIRSAEAAEARGARCAWGQQRIDQECIDPNWVFDCRLDDANEKSKAKKTANAVVAPAKRAARATKAPSPPKEQRVSEQKAYGSTTKEDIKREKNRIRAAKKREEMFEKATYKAGRMEKAVAGMKAFLDPQSLLGTNTLKDVIDAGYGFATPTKALGYTETQIRKSQVKTWEHKVLVVMAFAGAAKKYEKFYVESKFFAKKAGDPSAAMVLCETWREEAEEFVMTFVDLPFDKKANGADEHCELRGTLVEIYLRNMADLVKNCAAIDSAEKLDRMEKRGVNWEAGLEKMSETNQQLRSGNLALLINEARYKLLGLRNAAKVEPEPMEEEKESSESSEKRVPPRVATGAPANKEENDRLKEKEKEKKVARDKRRDLLKASLSRTAALAPPPAKLGAVYSVAQRASLSTPGKWLATTNTVHNSAAEKPPNWGSNSGGWGGNISDNLPSTSWGGKRNINLPSTSSRASGSKTGLGGNKNSGEWVDNVSGNPSFAAAHGLTSDSSEASGSKSVWTQKRNSGGWGGHTPGSSTSTGWGGKINSGGWEVNRLGSPSPTAAQNLRPGSSEVSGSKPVLGENKNSGGGGENASGNSPSAAAQGLPPANSEASGSKPVWMPKVNSGGWGGHTLDNSPTAGWGGKRNSGGWGGNTLSNPLYAAPQSLPTGSSEVSGSKPCLGGNERSRGWGVNGSGNAHSAAGQDLPPASSEASGSKPVWMQKINSGGWGGHTSDKLPTADWGGKRKSGGWGGNRFSNPPSAATQGLPVARFEASGSKPCLMGNKNSRGWGGNASGNARSVARQGLPPAISEANGSKSDSESTRGRSSAHDNSLPFGGVNKRTNARSEASPASTSARHIFHQADVFQERKRGLEDTGSRTFQSRENKGAQRGYKLRCIEAPNNSSHPDTSRAPGPAANSRVGYSIHGGQRPSQVALDDARVGTGRGRGRGKCDNLPAWMTKQGSNSLVSAVFEAPLQPVPTSSDGEVSKKPTTATIPMIDNDVLNKVVKIATSSLPALGRESVSTSGANDCGGPATERNVNLQLPNHGRMPAVNSNPWSGGVDAEPQYDRSSRLGGRDRSQTLPAHPTGGTRSNVCAGGWSTSAAGHKVDPQRHNHSQMLEVNDNGPPVGVRQSPREESVNRPRGRGRGRDQTKPAWMTREQKP